MEFTVASWKGVVRKCALSTGLYRTKKNYNLEQKLSNQAIINEHDI